MIRFAFKKGLRFLEGVGKRWTVIRRLVTGKIQLEDDKGEVKNLEIKELNQQWLEQKLIVDPESLGSGSNVFYLATPRDIASYSVDDQKTAERKQKYLFRLENRKEGWVSTPAKLQPVIDEIAKEIGDEDPPRASTVYAWWVRYRATKCITKLVDQRFRAGRKTDPVMRGFFEDAVYGVFLTEQKDKGYAVFDAMTEKVRNTNIGLPPEKRLRMVSRATVYRWLSDLHQYLVGAYGDVGWQAKPQQIPNADCLDVSWPVTSLAAEILINGSDGIQGILERIHRRYGVPDNQNGRLRGRFGHFYTLLYRGFPEQAFDFLRHEFENFVAEHWQGPMGRRNRNFPVSLLARLSWIPASHACRQLGISRRRLRVLVDEGKLAGERFISRKGRAFQLVRRADVQSMLALLVDEIDLSAASNILGLKKSRLAAIIRWLVPEAEKTGPSGCPWAIPRDRVDRLFALLDALPITNQESDESITLGTILRFWPWTDQEIAELLIATIKGEIQPLARVCGLRGINGLTYMERDLGFWHQQQKSDFGNSLSVPEAAEVLHVKQEVAYSLVRSGILRTSREKVGRRYMTRVPGTSLGGFRQAYVFGRDLAEEMGTSPRALAHRLDRMDVKPVCGPTVDGCRQYVFARSIALDLALDAMRGSCPAVSTQ